MRIHDSRPPNCVVAPSLAEDRDSLLDNAVQPVVVTDLVRNAFFEQIGQGLSEGIRGQQKRNRSGKDHDPIGDLLKLPQPLKIGNSRRNILYLDPEKGW